MFGLRRERLEVVDLVELTLNEHFNLVIIETHVLLELNFEIRQVGLALQLQVVRSANHSQITIVLGNNGARALALIDDRDFSEVVIIAQVSHE